MCYEHMCKKAGVSNDQEAGCGARRKEVFSMTECGETLFPFEAHFPRQVVAQFDGGRQAWVWQQRPIAFSITAVFS